jgi:hypothetical protein
MLLPQTHSRASAIPIDEFDAGSLKRAPNHFESCSTGLGYSSLNLTNRHNPNCGAIREVLLSPVEQPPGCPALCRGDHYPTMATAADSIKSVEKRLTQATAYFRLLYRK